MRAGHLHLTLESELHILQLHSLSHQLKGRTEEHSKEEEKEQEPLLDLIDCTLQPRKADSTEFPKHRYFSGMLLV